MTVEIPLKRKYRVGFKGRYRAGYSGNNKPAKQKHKLSEKEIALHRAQPEKVMVLMANGKRRMMVVQ